MQNDMRNRYAELIKEIGIKWEDLRNDFLDEKIDDIPDFQDFLTDNLIANGAILPPCKVDDRVFCIYNNKVIQGTVRLIRPFISKEETIFKGNIICEVENIFFDDGRKEEIELYVVFSKPYGMERVAYLTKKEAKQKLKESEEK